MLKYTGRLRPYRPVIAAMLLAGQSYRQVGDLLWEMGARSEFGDVADRGRQSTTGLVRVMDMSWSGKQSAAPLMSCSTGEPMRRYPSTMSKADFLEEVELSARLHNCIRNDYDILTVGDIRYTPDHEIKMIPNLGKVSWRELRALVPYEDPRLEITAWRELDLSWWEIAMDRNQVTP